MQKAEIIIYTEKVNNSDYKIEVRVEDDTVWLNQMQMAELFEATKQNVSLHIKNVFREGELDQSSTVKEYLTVQSEGIRKIKRKVLYYNLDVIISVGYRVKSLRGTKFRMWANKILKEYLLNGHVVNYRLKRVEEEVNQIKGRMNDIEFLVQTNLPPNEGVFYDSQIFDAWEFVSGLIREAKKSIILIDNYVDDSVLSILAKRNPGVEATVFTSNINKQLQIDLDKI